MQNEVVQPTDAKALGSNPKDILWREDNLMQPRSRQSQLRGNLSR